MPNIYPFNMKINYRCLLIGNANSGKTSLFNRLTGLSQKTGNFQGVTVEKHSGEVEYNKQKMELIDLPGSFSMNGFSEDKRVLSRFLMNRRETDRVIFVMDPMQMERSMQFLLQILDLGIETILFLSMKDILARKNISIDTEKIERQLGIKTYLINTKRPERLEQLKADLMDEKNFRAPGRIWNWDTKREKFFQQVLQKIEYSDEKKLIFVLNNTLKELSDEQLQQELPGKQVLPPETTQFLKQELDNANLNFSYQDELIEKSIFIKKTVSESISYQPGKEPSSISNQLDRFLLNPFWGLLIFIALMAMIFQALFNWSELPMEWIEINVNFLTEWSARKLPPGPLASLLSEGIIGGVGSVLIFIPQITFLFLFIGLLEESGYMARASLVIDKIMGRFGLSGKSFIPLLSSSACAVPGIMSARTIENTSERLITTLVAPFITCSARYPVYILVIGTVFPSTQLFGFLSLKAVVLFGMFVLGVLTSLLFALLFRKTYFKAEASYFILELPSYRIPSIRNIIQNLYQKVIAFIKNAGTIILYISILLWFLTNYPQKTVQSSQSTAGNYQKIALEQSYAGSFGRILQPVIEPLGYNWKIGIALITSFAAREVMVSTLHIIYGTGGDENSKSLKSALLAERDRNGKPVWNLATGLSILVFFAYACQCISTLAIVKKETNSWFWPLFLFSYMTIFAYFSALIVYQLAKNWG